MVYGMKKFQFGLYQHPMTNKSDVSKLQNLSKISARPINLQVSY